MANRIFIKDWLELKPYKKPVKTDNFYLKVCNEVQRALTTNMQSFVLKASLDREDINLLSCFLTSYFEDLISGTNIWNSFIRVHKRLYNKHLPFYNLDEYYEEEINQQDISFLIWYFLNTLEKDLFIAPNSNFISRSAAVILDVFDKEWDYAPENKNLQTYYQIDEHEAYFYTARKLMDTLLFKTYLFYTDSLLSLECAEFKILEKRKEDEHLAMLLNANRDESVHKIHTQLLSLKGKEWASEILKSNHKLKKDFLEMSKKIQGFFFYKGQDENGIFIEHIASGKKFEITKKSFDHSESFKVVDTILYMGIVRWKNEWWFSGVHFQQPFDPDFVQNEKKSMESMKATSFLDHHSNVVNDILENQKAAFEKFNNGSLIAFLPSESIDEFYSGYIEYYNKTLMLSEEKIIEANEKIKKNRSIGMSSDPIHAPYKGESGLVFFNPKRGIEIAMEINSAFPMPSNPFYKEEDSEKDVFQLLIDEDLSAELAYYCIENCKDMLSFFQHGIGKEYLNDIDFLLRFWKKENYHSEPAILLTKLEDN